MGRDSGRCHSIRRWRWFGDCIAVCKNSAAFHAGMRQRRRMHHRYEPQQMLTKFPAGPPENNTEAACVPCADEQPAGGTVEHAAEFKKVLSLVGGGVSGAVWIANSAAPHPPPGGGGGVRKGVP